MKQIFLLSISLSLFSTALFSQAQIPNGSFEAWSGIDTVRPDGWVTTEQYEGLQANKWVTQESRTGYRRTGSSAVRLVSDTIMGTALITTEAYGTFSHQSVIKTDTRTGNKTTTVEDYTYLPGVIGAGRVSSANGYVVASGVALHARPSTLSFYVRMNHPVPDTASFRLLLTRWNGSLGRADTVAYERRDIFPDSTAMMGYALFIDTIDYRLLGDADTAHITIFGGRKRNTAARGDTTWIDGVSFGYGLPTPLRSSALADSLSLSPNPVMNTMSVRADPSMQGFKIIIQAETSVIVKEITISTLNMTIDMTDLPVGNYTYGLIDRDDRQVRTGYIQVLRN